MPRLVGHKIKRCVFSLGSFFFFFLGLEKVVVICPTRLLKKIQWLTGHKAVTDAHYSNWLLLKISPVYV